MNKYKEIECIKDYSRICLIGHISTDADCLASLVVFREFLLSTFGIKKIDLLVDSDILPDEYLDILENVRLTKKAKKYDLAISLDCTNSSRAGKYANAFTQAKKRIVIDHHATNSREGDINIVEIRSSTCEIVYDILKEYNHRFTKSQYGILYAGIITDTMNFTVGEMDNRTFEIAGECYQYINAGAIYRHFLASSTMKNMRMLSLAINNIEEYENGQILYTKIDRELAQKLKAEDIDYIGIVNRISTIKGTKIACLVRPKDDFYTITIRSSLGINIGRIAEGHGGGGHACAAAFTISDDEEIKQTLLSEFKSELKNEIKTDRVF